MDTISEGGTEGDQSEVIDLSSDTAEGTPEPVSSTPPTSDPQEPPASALSLPKFPRPRPDPESAGSPSKRAKFYQDWMDGDGLSDREMPEIHHIEEFFEEDGHLTSRIDPVSLNLNCLYSENTMKLLSPASKQIDSVSCPLVVHRTLAYIHYYLDIHEVPQWK